MSALETIIAEVASSTRINPGQKEILLQFLQAGAPVLSSLESTALRELMEWLAGGGAPVAAEAAIGSLDAGQVVALLGVTQEEMNQALQERRAQVAAARAAINNLAGMALTIMARLVIASL